MRPAKKITIDLDQATSAEITVRHAYVTIDGRRYRAEKRFDDGSGAKGSRTTSGPRVVARLSEAQRKIIIESFKRYPATDVTPGPLPERSTAADLRVKVSYTLPAGLIEEIRDEAIATGEPVSRVVERRLKK
ncbi:MAG: hypothetical protein IKE64_14955 [Thermoguttaceae bacterium]|nr:hypothetical protein [Thermoguttaceae bacterium]